MDDSMQLYVPKGPKRLVDRFKPEFFIREETSDIKAVEEVWSKNAYRRTRDGFEPKPGEFWMDLGANVGAFSVMASKFGARVAAIEAEERNVPICAANMNRNGIENPEVVHAAVVPDSFQGETVTLYVNDTPMGLRRHSVLKARKKSRPVHVQAMRISDICDRWRPDGMKINIEGVEIQLLKEWEIPASLHYVVLEWSFDVDNKIITLARAFERLSARYRNVHMSKKIDFTKATYDYYPPNVYLFGWD